MDGPVPPEIESTFRVAALALFSGADQGAVSNYLKMAANQRRQECRSDKVMQNYLGARLRAWLIFMIGCGRCTLPPGVSTEAKILRNLAVQIKKTGPPLESLQSQQSLSTVSSPSPKAPETSVIRPEQPLFTNGQPLLSEAFASVLERGAAKARRKRLTRKFLYCYKQCCDK